MDEGTLNDLLECSVCLERLDTSSKVLPCQHTFCRKCLEEILQKHKELRCPECRVLVHSKVEELPPNVLLMRILEGMRNAIPKKVGSKSNRSPANISPATVFHATTPQHGTPEHRTNSNKQASPHLLPHQPYAKALYDYTSKEVGDLNFKRGDIIFLKKRLDNHWYQGECGGKQGVFPLSYVQVVTPVPSHTPQCKALYDFRMTNDEEEGCLAFCKGDIINVIRRVDENWAEGKLDGRIGIFPLAFVELNNLARSLMKLSTNAQPGPSRLAPPTPTTDDSTPLIPTDHTRTIVPHQPVVTTTQVSTHLVTSDSSSTVSSGSSSTTTPNISSSNTSSSSSTAPSSPASPPPRNQPVQPPRVTTQKPELVNTNKNVSTPTRTPNATTNQPTRTEAPAQASSHHNNKEKRHSLTSLTSSHHTTNTFRHSAEIVPTDAQSAAGHLHAPERSRRSNGHSASASEVQHPVAYIALYPYKPQKADELELKKGGIYMVTEKCQDGWYKGTSNRTQKCGVFPGNYVTVARGVINPQQVSSSKDGANNDNAKAAVSYTKSGKCVSASRLQTCNNPPELPPRSVSPAVAANTISSSWHGQQDSAAVPLGRSSSAIMSNVVNAQHATTTTAAAMIAKSDKTKDRKEKGTVSLMRRLTSMKRSKSPPASTYSMDNPVFEDSSLAVVATPTHPVHVRSGSCPSQLLQLQPTEHHRMFGSTSQRHKHKERPSVLNANTRTTENPAGSSGSSPDIHRHRKSNSLDAGNRSKTGVQTVRERFRCIAPYPPNSEYELELQVNDIIYVHKKREDGWYKGTQQRTGRTGLFPASFVEGF